MLHFSWAWAHVRQPSPLQHPVVGPLRRPLQAPSHATGCTDIWAASRRRWPRFPRNTFLLLESCMFWDLRRVLGARQPLRRQRAPASIVACPLQALGPSLLLPLQRRSRLQLRRSSRLQMISSSGRTVHFHRTCSRRSTTSALPGAIAFRCACLPLSSAGLPCRSKDT